MCESVCVCMCVCVYVCVCERERERVSLEWIHYAGINRVGVGGGTLILELRIP